MVFIHLSLSLSLTFGMKVDDRLGFLRISFSKSYNAFLGIGVHDTSHSPRDLTYDQEDLYILSHQIFTPTISVICGDIKNT